MNRLLSDFESAASQYRKLLTLVQRNCNPSGCSPDQVRLVEDALGARQGSVSSVEWGVYPDFIIRAELRLPAGD